MEEKQPGKEVESAGGDARQGTATAKPKRNVKPRGKPTEPLPPWKVLLHNDDVNGLDFVVKTIVQLTPLNEKEAIQRTDEAHRAGLSLLLTTHKERAELYAEQFVSKGLTVTIEADA